MCICAQVCTGVGVVKVGCVVYLGMNRNHAPFLLGVCLCVCVSMCLSDAMIVWFLPSESSRHTKRGSSPREKHLWNQSFIFPGVFAKSIDGMGLADNVIALLFPVGLQHEFNLHLHNRKEVCRCQTFIRVC